MITKEHLKCCVEELEKSLLEFPDDQLLMRYALVCKEMTDAWKVIEFYREPATCEVFTPDGKMAVLPRITIDNGKKAREYLSKIEVIK